MLASSRLQTIICTSRLAEAERFYGEVLAFCEGQVSRGVIYDVGGGDLLVAPVPSTQPSAHTVAGFAVPDLSKVIIALRERGVQWERIPGLSHDETGVFVIPWGARVVWLRDPDGNLLSIVQYP